MATLNLNYELRNGSPCWCSGYRWRGRDDSQPEKAGELQRILVMLLTGNGNSLLQGIPAGAAHKPTMVLITVFI